jgi:hypothetical protein
MAKCEQLAKAGRKGKIASSGGDSDPIASVDIVVRSAGGVPRSRLRRGDRESISTFRDYQHVRALVRVQRHDPG